MSKLFFKRTFRKNVQAPQKWKCHGRGSFTGIAGKRRINLIERDGNQSEVSTQQEEDKLVLHIGGDGNQPLLMKGIINNQIFQL